MATQRLMFTVLCPNGRRQRLSVPSNASCLQVLEEACKKQNLDPEDYELKHFNKRVDLSLSVKFANFANNAMLELHPAEERRIDKAVTIGLQLESGERLMHEFLPSSTLWNIINHWQMENKLINDNEKYQPVCIYMRIELIGKEKLEKTTLRDLGLTSGRAAIRLLYREPDSLKEQAHVDIPINRPYIPYRDIPTSRPSEQEEIVTEMNTDNYQHTDKNEKNTSSNGISIELNPNLQDGKTTNAFNFHQEMVSALKRKQVTTSYSDNASSSFKLSKEDALGSKIADYEEKNELGVDVEMEETEEKVIYIGSRNAVLFNREDISPWKPDDIPDQFYELTIDDARFMLHDLARQRKELDEKPLETTALREAKQLELASKYRYTVIRVYFPERFVLQALFQPNDAVGDIMEFIRSFLNNRDSTFSLYTTPPKQVLSPETVLYKAGLVPAAVLHFSSPEKKTSYLNDNLKTQVSSPTAAHQAAFLSRNKTIGSD